MLEMLLRSKAEVKVLGIALFTDGIHLREISRRAGVSVYETRRELGTLESLGILKSEKRGNLVLFHVNGECPFLQDLKNLYMKTEGVFFELREVLGRTEGVRYAFVFGSAARGTEKAHSDIDLMVIGDVGEERLAERMLRIQKKTSRAINFILWSGKDLQEKIKTKSGFLKNVMQNKRTWLMGDEHEFIGVVGKGYGAKG